jgi:hypothetical protein
MTSNQEAGEDAQGAKMKKLFAQLDSLQKRGASLKNILRVIDTGDIAQDSVSDIPTP